jgi:pimeloyl-ACP methyl ester carboxylesterase
MRNWRTLLAACNSVACWLSRIWRGVCSALAGYFFVLGSWWPGKSWSIHEGRRLEHGLIVVLPGVEGAGPLNWSIVRGILDAEKRAAVKLVDWTTGFWPFFPFHLRAHQRNRRKASAIAQMIVDYQSVYPDRPVFIVGHSGGAALAVWVLEALPEERTVTAAILLGVALSPRYPLGRALERTEQGVWSFFSRLDLLFLALGTWLFGTFDGRHTISAGWCGFVERDGMTPRERSLYRNRLHQFRYHPRLLGRFHPGGHFGWANRVFIAETVAPLLASHGGRKSFCLPCQG